MDPSNMPLYKSVLEALEEDLEAARTRVKEIESARNSIKVFVGSSRATGDLSFGHSPAHSTNGSADHTAFAVAKRVWDSILACQEQVDACVVMAEANDGFLDLKEVLSLVRKAGLSTADNDRNLKRNLDTRIKQSDKFTSIGNYKYYLKGWEPVDLEVTTSVESETPDVDLPESASAFEPSLNGVNTVEY